MLSTDDHRYEPHPRPALNIDVVRVLAAVETPQDLRTSAANVITALAPVARVKNGFALSDEKAAQDNFHLRIVLVNVLFTSSEYSTYGDMVRDEEVAKVKIFFLLLLVRSSFVFFYFPFFLLTYW